ncbi:cytochrome P450 [Lophiostoma macrostomum CBS 122681]|uniref:Cytochrome P450 n=1 Tax=Lophiostoma macrostomum CBS 122681 TaxID=1314788 RepID=A0A6A6T486_9PLEO|nr:cytochrome P450 [Lophiostoma macrostomum CBS 122681]
MEGILYYLVLCAGAALLYALSLAVYRLFFHPLSGFPGPKIAAATQWYEAYFDLVKYPRGQFMFEIERMHQAYGPIVRINPHELHVKDPSWEKVLYVGYSEGVRDKYPPAAAMAGLPGDVFGTVSQELHSMRRRAFSSLLSRASIQQVQPILQDHLEVLCKKLRTDLNQGAVRLDYSILALTADTIGVYAFGESLGLLEDGVKARDWHRTNRTVGAMIPVIRLFPWSMPLALSLPTSLVRAFDVDVARVLELRHEMRRQAFNAVDEYSKPDKTAAQKDAWTSILGSKLPNEEKHPLRMADEAFTLIVAGGETTARAICLAIFHVLANKRSIMPRLQEELLSVMPEEMSAPELKPLERLPWLTAIVKETLRICHGLVAARLPLIAREAPLRYGEWHIPAGTPVSMSQCDTLYDPNIFPDPMKFDPSRWLPENPELQNLNQHYAPFGRGSRMCVGWNMAMAEMYMTIATIFRRFDLELYDTVRERDIDLVRDCFLQEPSFDAKGVGVQLVNTSA